MSARGTDFPARLARGIALAALLALLGAVVYHFFDREPPPSGPVAEGTLAEGGKVDRKEGIQHLEFEDGKAWLDVRGARFFLGDDGRSHLEGNVTIVDRRSGEGPEMVVTADKVSFDRDRTRFSFSGGVAIREEDALLESPSFEYDKTAGIVRTDRGAVFRSPGMAGSAGDFNYDLAGDRLRLSGGFRLEIGPEGDDRGRTRLEGETLVYDKAAASGEAAGSVTVVREGFTGECLTLRFELTPDGNFLEEMTMSGGARCAIEDSASGGKGAAGQAVEAEEIRIAARPGTAEIAEIEARRGCLLSVALSQDRRAGIRGEAVGMDFAAAGLRRLEASGKAGAILEEEDGETSLEGRKIVYEKDSGLLTVEGSLQAKALAESPGSRIEADSVLVGIESGRIRAAGGVKGHLLPRAGEDAIGFFLPGKPVFFVCRKLDRDRETGTLDFEGGVRVWQEDDYIEAEALGFHEETGAVSGRGGVLSVLFRAAEGRDAARLESGGERMDYDPAEREITFAGSSFARTEEARISSRSLRIVLRPGGEGVRGLEARENVVIRRGRVEGRGGEAIYDLEAETIVLSKSPVLSVEDRSSVRGDKLTFRLADDKIFIENKGQERSVAVIKS